MPPLSRRAGYALLFLLLAVAGGRLPGEDGGAALEAAFRDPPAEARPWVFWYWMNACSSRAGIAADLQAMKAAGIGGAHLVPIRGAASPSVFEPTAEQFSPLWWDHVRFAVAEARRLSLGLALHVSDGYATAGGPWVTPERSMQKVVWTLQELDGGGSRELHLAQPETNEGFYRDICVVAFPSWPGAGGSRPEPVVTTSAPGAAPQFLAREGNLETFRSDQACWIRYAYPEPFTCRSVTVRVPPTKGVQSTTYQANRLALEVSDDGRVFRPVAQFVPPRHGWQDGEGATTHAIPETTARYFRFTYSPGREEPGAEDLEGAKWKTILKLRGLRLSSQPRIDDFEGKSGQSWRISARTRADQLPAALCVPRDHFVDLSRRLGADGTLRWDAPPGRWLVLRLGHTSTGYRNDTAGAMKGLECDKFDPSVAREMADRWFGEIVRRVGPEAARDVIKVLHVDSWECGSQNWSGVFRAEFTKRRGYDPLPYLPAMAGIPVESLDVSERFLRDVRETISELIRDNFFGPLREEAHARGCTLSAEAVAPVGVSDNLAVFSAVDTPMGEFWLRSPTHDKPTDVLDAVSGARLYGRRIVQAEAYTELRNEWDETPAILKPLGDRNLALGVNRFVYHVFTHNPWIDRSPGMTLGGVGSYLQRDQTWWRAGAAWNRYTARCQAVLQQGAPLADVAVFTGDEAPRRAVAPWHLGATLPGFFSADDARLGKRIVEAEDWSDPLSGYAYDSINRDALLRLASVRGGRLELPGGASYALLIVPARTPSSPESGRMTPEVLNRLLELVESGATVLLAERPRLWSEAAGGGAEEAAAARTLGRLWPEKAAPGSVRRLGRGRVVCGPYRPGSFQPLGLERDLGAAGGLAPPRGFAWTHRVLPGADVYFISRQQAPEGACRLSFRVAGKKPELWDPVTGETAPAPNWSVESGRTTVTLQLPANGSVFVVFRTASSAGGNSTVVPAEAPSAPVRIDGPWTVRFSPALGGPAEPLPFGALVSWTERPENGVRHYSGTASYAARFVWTGEPGAAGRVWLDLGEVADLAEVAVNGVDCGVAWTPPYRVDITAALHQGENDLRIDVTNTWFNRLAGDRGLPEKQRVTHTTAPDRTEGKPLRKAGLLGPVAIGRAR